MATRRGRRWSQDGWKEGMTKDGGGKRKRRERENDFTSEEEKQRNDSKNQL
jgi:hypothetical protein